MVWVSIFLLLMSIQRIETQPLKGLEERVDKLEALLSHQAGLIELMTKTNIDQEKEIKRLEDQVRRMKLKETSANAQQKGIRELKYQVRRINALENKTGAQQNEINELREQLKRLQEIPSSQHNNRSKGTNSRFEFEIFKLANRHANDNKMTNMTRKMKRIEPESQVAFDLDDLPSRRALTMKSAFYAYMSKNEPSIGRHHTLIFDTVKTNVNNGYSPFTGAFNVPDTGNYVFTYTIRLYSNHYASFEIIKNAEVVGTILNEHNNDDEQDTITGVIVISVNHGDVVYVRTHQTFASYGNIYSDPDGRSSFSGWLI